MTRSRSAPLLLVIAAFVVSRLLYEPLSLGLGTFSFRGDIAGRAAEAVRGERFNVATLGNGMPILDRELLLHDLGRSVWYLHSQPPLFNLLVAGILRLPGNFARNYQWLNWTMGVAFFVLTFTLMLRVGVPPWLASAATSLFLLMPNAMWLENAVYYGLPLGLLMLIAFHAFDKALQRNSILWLTISAVAIVTLVLMRAFFTLAWCAIMIVLLAGSFWRRHGRPLQVIAAVVLPFALVLAFQVKQYRLFGQILGSSWFGCNLATMTAGMGPEKQEAYAAGKVSPLVNVYRNDAPEAFFPYFPPRPTGIPALDQTRKSTGQPNFNHQVYIPVGRQYLRDTLYLIARAPHKYAINVINSIYIFSGYQIGLYFERPAADFFSKWSWREIAAPFLGFPLIAIAVVHGVRRVRERSDDRHLFAFMLFNIVYVIGVSCLIEKSEGPVYRQQIEAFLWSLLALAAARARLPVLVRGPRLADVRN
jgi:hypothetical protein